MLVTMFAVAARVENKSVCSVLIYDNSRPSQLNIAFSSQAVVTGDTLDKGSGGGGV